MVSRNKSILLWVVSIIITLCISYYQRMTGPTRPVRSEVEINDNLYKFKLHRTFDGDKAPVKIKIEGKNIQGKVYFKVFRSPDEWKESPMKYKGEYLTAYLPHMPPAGKIEYKVELNAGDKRYFLTDVPTVIRYKGAVPVSILIPHIILMFLAILFSFRTGIEALFKGHRTFKYTTITLVSLFIGGLILGPIVQNYAFGDYWTGWPFGGDWTDNKTIFAFLFWVIAWFVLKKNKKNKFWPILAAVVLFSIYMIPHSMGGSELDPETGKVTTGLKE